MSDHRGFQIVYSETTDLNGENASIELFDNNSDDTNENVVSDNSTDDSDTKSREEMLEINDKKEDNESSKLQKQDHQKEKIVKGSRKSDGKKRETECPIKSCRAKRYDLPRHMRLVHQWSDSEAKHVKALYGLRKTYDSKVKKKNPETKTYRISKACSVDGCRAIVINLPRHLSGVHNIDSNSEEFEILKARAVRMEGPQSKRPKLEVGTQKTKNESLTLVLNKELIESDSEDSSFEYYTQSSTSSSSSSSPSLSICDSQSRLLKRGPETADFQKSMEEDDSPWRESSDGDHQDAGFSDDDLIAELTLQTPKGEMREIMDAFYNFLVSADSANKDPTLHSSAKSG